MNECVAEFHKWKLLLFKPQVRTGSTITGVEPGFPLYLGIRRTEVGVPPSKLRLVRSTHWRKQRVAAPALKSRSLGVRKILLSALPGTSSPLLFSLLCVAFLSYPVLPGRKKASHKLITAPLTCPRAALGIRLALSHSRKGRQPAPPSEEVAASP